LASVRIDPGTSAITSGNVAVSYIANTGVTVVDNISAIGGGTTVQSTNLTYGAVHFNSVIVTGVTGGASPGVQMDSLNVLAANVDPNFASFAVLKNTVDSADNGVISTYASAGAYAPSTTPNGTHTFGVIASFSGQG
jgi:predicted transcriptional regulator